MKLLRLLTENTDWAGRYVLVRASLNVSLQHGAVRDMFRIEHALPTLRYLHEAGAKVIIISHLGRDETATLRPVYEVLRRYLPVQWGGVHTSPQFQERRALMGNGDLLMAENLRTHTGETTNDPLFATTLADLGEVYVNDAFAVAHRKHASVYALAKMLPAYAGLTLAEEVEKLTPALKPSNPSLFLLGGAKFSTKLPLIKKYTELYDEVFIGGALLNDVLRTRGFEVGRSLVSEVDLSDESFVHSSKLIMPLDVVVERLNGQAIIPPEEVAETDVIMDCGPRTIEHLANSIEASSTILWNGPFGAYERGYIESTARTARYIAAASATSIVGGGDTIAAIERLGLNDRFTFVSTGGGAMLTFLEKGTTDVIDLLRA